MNPELDRIQRDLSRARQRVQEIESGQRGVPSPGPWLSVDGDAPGAGLAHSAQLNAQRAAVDRLEMELVMALLPTWGGSKVLTAMSHVCPAAEPTLQVLKVDTTRDALAALIGESDGKYIHVSKLQELIT